MKRVLTKNEQAVLSVLAEAGETAASLTVAQIGGQAGLSKVVALRTLNSLFVRGYVSRPELANIALRVVDAAILETNPGSQCGLPERVLMAGFIIGTGDEDRICRMGLDAKEVRVVGDRLRANGVWDGGGVCEPESGVEYDMFCNIAIGHMSRAYNRSKRHWEYALTPAGIAHVKKMMKSE